MVDQIIDEDDNKSEENTNKSPNKKARPSRKKGTLFYDMYKMYIFVNLFKSVYILFC